MSSEQLITHLSDSQKLLVYSMTMTSQNTFGSMDRPITVDEACELRLLLFGNIGMSFGPEWLLQGFTFRDSMPLYGLIQKRAGPCGVLAAVQAWVLYEFLFGFSRTVLNSGHLKPDVHEKREAVTRAFVRILMNAGESNHVVWAAKSDEVVWNDTVGNILPKDGMIEYLQLKLFSTRESLQDFLFNLAPQIMEEDSGSCVSLLYSVILTRGIDRIKQDMDDPNNCLIGHDSYCSQEIVNLFLIGKAVPNLFDGDIKLNSGGEAQTVHHGVPEQSLIGLLSIYEYQDMFKVGDHYKTPCYPIWIVVTESHFSVLFGKSRDILRKTAVNDTFILHYYDGLSSRSEELTYVVELTDVIESKEKDFMLPPVMRCILTKWPNAKVSGKW